MALTFRNFHTQISFKLHRIETTGITNCALHNYLCRRGTSFWQEVSNIEEFEADENVFIPLKKRL
jgi:hypothetical protein